MVKTNVEWKKIRQGLFYFVLAYLFLILCYSVALYIVEQRITFLSRVCLDYGIKAFLTIPIWWLIFVRLKNVPFQQRIWLHGILCPLYVASWLQLYHLFSDIWGLFYLTGVGMIWDIYIPFILYIAQFAVFHIYEYLDKAHVLQKAKLKSEISALKAQINPHFLYNVLNTINASLQPEQEDTREMLAQLADLFRYQAEVAEKEWVRLEEEITFLEKYVGLEKARFREKLTVEFQIAPHLKHLHISPLLLQPLVENALKHGIAPLLQAGKVILKIEQVGKDVQFTVTDTGKGATKQEILTSHGIGIKNVQLRLEKLYNTTLHFQNQIPQGLSISFTIPLFETPPEI
jgi:signal transduction histidine kinase